MSSVHGLGLRQGSGWLGGEAAPLLLRPLSYGPRSVPQEDVPPRLCTSPIPWGGLSGVPSDSQLGTASEPEGLVFMGRRKRRRRRKPRRKEDAVTTDSSSEELEAGTESEPSQLEKPKPESPGCVETRGETVGVGFNSCFLS